MFFVGPAVAQQRDKTDDKIQAVEKLFRDVGLFGTWAVDCAQPAAAANPRVNVSMPTEGLVVEVHDLGAELAPSVYNIVAAERQGTDRVSVDVLFQPGTEAEEQQKLVIQVGRNTRRTLFNQPAKGPVRVRDGAVTGGGFKTPTLNRCE